MLKFFIRTALPFLAGSIFVILFSLSWVLFTEDNNSEFPVGIKKVDVEYRDRKVYLQVYTFRPLSCETVIKSLDIEPITIKDKTYSPKCTITDNLLITIVYENLGNYV